MNGITESLPVLDAGENLALTTLLDVAAQLRRTLRWRTGTIGNFPMSSIINIGGLANRAVPKL